MSSDQLDPEILAARQRQAANVRAVDFTALPPEEGRAVADTAAMFFNDNEPAIANLEELSIPGCAGTMRARLYRPSAGSLGAILYLHGGGWFHCNVDTHDRLMRLLALRSGKAVLGFDYRLAPEHPFPAALEDTLAAWRWLCANVASLNLKAEALAIAGDSAGANLALSAALSLRDAKLAMPAALALFYGCYAPDFDTDSHRRLGDGRFGLTTARIRWYWQNYAGTDLGTASTLAAPMKADLRGLPPTYLCLAGLDPISDDTRALAQRLSGSGVPCELKEWPGTGHGFLQMTRDVAVARKAIDHAAAFLSAKLA
jgi:acetyl esterase